MSWAQIARANRKVVHSQMQFARLLGYISRYDSGYRPEQPGLFDEAPAVGTLPPNIAASLARALANIPRPLTAAGSPYGTAGVPSIRHFRTGRPSRYRDATRTWLTALSPRSPSR